MPPVFAILDSLDISRYYRQSPSSLATCDPEPRVRSRYDNCIDTRQILRNVDALCTCISAVRRTTSKLSYRRQNQYYALERDLNLVYPNFYPINALVTALQARPIAYL